MSMLIGKVEPGDVIGRCRILRELGRGGVGTVYLARHQTLQIEVALKVLSPALSLDQPALAERFIREAQLAARIRHPHVIAVMDAAHDEPTGLYYIVFEYVGGGALSWHLRNGPLPETKALALMHGIAQALVVAEENSIVHRDIKPENIMLDARGTAKLADLGLAKHDIDSRTSLTLGGSYMGTPAYMSPEQARDAKAADTRDDIYSLGATFYECLTGEPPFTGDTPYNIMSKLLTRPSPKASDRRADISRSADAICRKMMAKTRGLRYGDARALVRDLEHCLAHGDGGFNGLEASTFARDSIMGRQKALQHGVQPASDEVLSDAMTESPPAPPAPRHPPLLLPTEEERAVRAAAWLIALVLTATALLAFFGHRYSTILAGMAPVTPPASPVATAVAPPEKKKKEAHAVATKPVHHDDTNVASDSRPKPFENAESVPLSAPPRALPVVLPAAGNAADTNGLVPALSLNDTNAPVSLAPAATNLAVAPVVSPDPSPTNAAPFPAASALPPSAFGACAVAEAGLRPSLIGHTGEAGLLKIIGRRTPSSPAPRIWTFYFYDTSATGNARFITVRDGRVMKDGQDLPVALSPWHTDDVIPEDRLKIDSTAALATAQALIPNVPITSSSFELIHPANATTPLWRITLWADDRNGQEQELGTVQILTDTGYVLTNDLKAPGA